MKKLFISVCLVIVLVLTFGLSACYYTKEVVGVSDLLITEDGELIIKYSDDTFKNLGKIHGEDGEDGQDGVGIKNIELNNNGELVVTYTDNRSVNLGKIPACTHRFSNWVPESVASCVSHGHFARQCLDCGYVERSTTAAVGHDFDNSYVVSEPTCLKEGLTLYVCSVCSATKAEISGKTDHVFVNGECKYCGFEVGSEDLIYEEIADESGEVVAYCVKGLQQNSTAVDIVIPSFYLAKPVTKIEEGAFADNWDIESVKIGRNIVEIGGSAFYYCLSLETVYWNATACIYAGAIDAEIFAETENVKNIYIGENVTIIPDFAFEGCLRVESLEIPSSVKYIGKYAFVNMISLRSIDFDGTIAQWEAIVKGAYWNVYVHDCVVHCDDGDIELPVTSFTIKFQR